MRARFAPSVADVRTVGPQNAMEGNGTVRIKAAVHTRLMRVSQNWRRNVKTRFFVMTLRDHYREMAMNPDLTSTDRIDNWALQYIDLNWLNPIMDAFDDDGTGFITIGEINRFTSDLPETLDWR